MASPAPDRSNNYAAASDTVLSAAMWNSVFSDIAGRMTAVEVKATGYDDLVNAGIGVALTKINDGIAPSIQQLSALLQQANLYLTQVKANVVPAEIIVQDTNNRFVNDTQVVAINSIPALASAVAALKAKPSNEGRSFFFATM